MTLSTPLLALVSNAAIGHVVIFTIFVVMFLCLPAAIMYVEDKRTRERLAADREWHRSQREIAAVLFNQVTQQPIAKKTEVAEKQPVAPVVEPGRRRFLPLNPSMEAQS